MLPPAVVDSATAAGSHLQTQPGLSLSMSLRPVPARLVSLIHSGRYVEMVNAAVGRHMEASVGASILQVSARPPVREVTTLPSWICCFLTYLAVGTSDVVTRERLAYAILVVREALRHGGMGWIEYDRSFRQQAALDSSIRWNVLNPGLLASTVMAQQTPSCCPLCQQRSTVRTPLSGV